MKWEWRPAVVAVVASLLLAGCAPEVELSSSCSASMTTSPDWVFGLMLSSGLLALLSGAVWVSFIPGVVTGPPRPAPKRWWSQGGPAHRVLAVACLGYTQYQLWDMRTQVQDVYIQAIFAVITAPILGGLYVASRRHRATGVWPSGRQAPWGFFWALPLVCVAAASSTFWAVTTMANSSVSIPC
jgi:hypothetical protein